MRARACASILALAFSWIGCASQPSPPPVTPSAPIAEVAPAPPPAPLVPAPTRIAFGSCNDVQRPQVLWEPIAQLAPTAFVWLGDIIYADTEDMTKMRALYDELRALPAYAALSGKTRILGTWDDHDYGGDDMGREYPKRVESQQALLDFLGEPEDSPRRAQEGVYTAVDLGEDPYRVRVILLDTRYHRDRPGPATDVLGEAQWSWLERQLAGSTAAVHVIASSIQLVPEQHGFEKWNNFPSARQRLFALFDRVAPRNLIVLSGDRHFGELSMLEREGKAPIFDLTSSSLSKPWTKKPTEENRYRVGDVVWDVNFGVIEVDWRASPQVLRLQLHGRDGALALEHVVPLATATAAPPGATP